MKSGGPGFGCSRLGCVVRVGVQAIHALASQLAPGFPAVAWAILFAMALAGPLIASDEFWDDLDQSLTFHSRDDWARARVSGTVELEGYHFQQPAPAFIDASGNSLFVPRATLFLDVQLGTRVYAFAQARGDRGFDPSDESGRARLDEFAVRFSAVDGGMLNAQIGKFATIVGNWTLRHSSWDNPLINAPLAYEELTGIWDSEAAPNANVLLFWSHVRGGAGNSLQFEDKYLRVPILWGPSYATGVALSGAVGQLEYAVEMKNAGVQSRPALWNDAGETWRHPAVNARIGYRPNPMWHFGLSLADSPYLRTHTIDPLPAGLGRGDYRQRIIAQDASFAWHHWQLWAECFEARFSNPAVGDARVFSYYLETKYKLTPRWFVAGRWNQQRYGQVTDLSGARVTWGSNVSRIDLASGFRFTAHTQLKFEYSLEQRTSGPRENGHLLAAQFVLKF